MSTPSEESLDRHFAAQLQMVSGVFMNSISPSQNDIIHRWLTKFYDAPSSDKFARNCLMVLLMEQLREMDKLGKPFTDLDNTNRPLEEILTLYEIKNLSKMKNQKEHEQSETVEEDSSNVTVVKGYVEIDAEPKHSSGQMSTEDKFNIDTCSSSGRKKSEYELQSEKNRLMIEEINNLHARTVENQQFYQETKAIWESVERESLQTRENKMLVQKVVPNAKRAIRRLKDWTPSKGPLNFLLITLQNIIDDSPETRRSVEELDREMEQVLTNLVEQEAERREMNMRIFYDQLIKSLLQQKQHALTEVRQQKQSKEQLHYDEEKPMESSFQSTEIEDNQSLSSSSLQVHLKSDKGLNNFNECDCEYCQQLKSKFSK